MSGPDLNTEAAAFAESVAGVLARRRPPIEGWFPGSRDMDGARWSGLSAELDGLGWGSLAEDPQLSGVAGAAAVALGRALAPVREVDRLLGAAPVAGELVRCLWAGAAALSIADGVPKRRRIISAAPRASAEGLDVHHLIELGEGSAEAIEIEGWACAAGAWRAANVGYLAGLGDAALALTVDYVRQRRAFGGTLGGLAPVQQLLAGAATSVRGVGLLASAAPDGDALAHAGPAVTAACAACQQVTGAIGFTLEYPLHRYTQRARALATWNDALLAGPLFASA